MNCRALLAALALSWTAAAWCQTPIARWSFDATPALDTVTTIADPIRGAHGLVAGVAGQALEFDGMTTHILRDARTSPQPRAGFTVESWIALDAYPWNWVPIVDQQLDHQAGYACSIDAYGHLGVQASIDGAWQMLTSKTTIPLKRWTHVACVFAPGDGLSLYINGQTAATLQAPGALSWQERVPLLIGRVREAEYLHPSALVHPFHKIFYSLEGALDELSIYGEPLSGKQIDAHFHAIAPPAGPSSEWAKLPRGAGAGRSFGAYYETLKFQPSWDRLRRIGPASDVVVHFGARPLRLVFWQGLNYIPAWVSENNKWYTDEFMEAYSLPQCPGSEDCEPMSDKQARYSHVRILESSPARAVVHWRYALNESMEYKGAYADPLTGWFDWADEYWTVYPDGVAVRKQVLWTSRHDGARLGDKPGPGPHEFQETIVVMGPGERPEDNLHNDALTLVNLDGESATYMWHPKKEGIFDYPDAPKDLPKPDRANIQWVNLRAQWKPFQISPTPATFDTYAGEKTYSTFEWWNHWPVAQIDSSGRPALAPDRPSHTSLSHMYWPTYSETPATITKIFMDGMTTEQATALVPLAKSWLAPAPIAVRETARAVYDPTQRAYVIDAPPAGALHVTLNGTAQTPVVNPAFVLAGWERGARVTGAACQTGRVSGESRDGTVVWCELRADRAITLEIAPTPDDGGLGGR